MDPSTPVWTSREGWIASVTAWAQTPGFAEVCRAARTSMTPATLVSIAAAMAAPADHGTGRHVAVTRAKIAARVGCSVDTITVAWRVLRVAGWAIEAARGHGSPGTPPQGRRPSIYHLVTRRPPRPVVDNHDLPRKRVVGSSPHLGNYSPSAQKNARHHDSRSMKSGRGGAAPRPPRPLAVQRLADELVGNRYGRLGRCHGLNPSHIGAVCDAITAAGIDPAVWTGRAIADALNADMARTGWSWPARIDNPAAFLAARLKRLDWRPVGPPESGGVAAAGMDKGSGSVGDEARPLTAAQRARIEAARAEIRAVLAARKRRASA